MATSFDRSTTTDEVLDGIDLTGRRVVITGAASGLGLESARSLAAHGASITAVARSRERADGAVEQIQELVPGADVEAGVADLGDLATIRAFTDDFLAHHDRIDVLLNNAGVMACPFGRTADGFETQFGTNHLGHFLLTARLMSAVLAGDSPRVVTLSSAGHSRSDVDLDDPNFESTEYSPWLAYGRAKTANALFARELANRYGDRGVLSYSVHPGGIVTDLGRHLTQELIDEMLSNAVRRSDEAAERDGSPDAAEERPRGMQFKSVEAGAATQVWASTSSDADLLGHNGAYLADCGLGVLGADPGTNGFTAYLLDDEKASALWTISEELVGEGFVS